MAASHRRARRRHRSADFSEILRQIADHEQRLNQLEKRTNQLRLDSTVRWDVLRIPGTNPPQYQVSLLNEATGVQVPLAVV